MPDLTEEAKAEIREAIRIVREDKDAAFQRYVRSKLDAPVEPPKPADPPKIEPPVPPVPPTPVPPTPVPPTPVPPPPNPPTNDPPAKRRSGYWGDLDD